MTWCGCAKVSASRIWLHSCFQKSVHLRPNPPDRNGFFGAVRGIAADTAERRRRDVPSATLNGGQVAPESTCSTSAWPDVTGVERHLSARAAAAAGAVGRDGSVSWAGR
ncbi:hypothetical protein AGIG_G18360 [Arapaima gigas]